MNRSLHTNVFLINNVRRYFRIISVKNSIDVRGAVTPVTCRSIDAQTYGECGVLRLSESIGYCADAGIADHVYLIKRPFGTLQKVPIVGILALRAMHLVEESGVELALLWITSRICWIVSVFLEEARYRTTPNKFEKVRGPIFLIRYYTCVRNV